ncbi:MAG: flagellar hook-basal body complex protein FliE [Eubacterium sp.]|jgi:flagellar hook-basal body complex protein FliE|nr:flagellar hook-basal body complex protein FliE [Eubacterium sp.]
MDVSSLYSVSPDYLTKYGLNNSEKASEESNKSFGSILDAAMNMINETNDYQNAAESAEIQFALGEAVSTHELAVAQQKANIALQYTVAVRDKVMEAYKEIMNMQI